MTEIQQNRYDQLVRRVNNIVAPGSMVSDALSELFPVLELESLKTELQLLGKTRLAFGNTTLLASVGDLNHHQLFNPVDSGMLVVLERMDINSATSQLIEYGLATVALADFTANQAFRDTREGILQPVVAQARDVQQVGSIARFGAFRIIANTTFTMQDKQGLFLLAPGTGITFASVTANTVTNVTFQWRERVAQPAELNFP